MNSQKNKRHIIVLRPNLVINEEVEHEGDYFNEEGQVKEDHFFIRRQHVPNLESHI